MNLHNNTFNNSSNNITNHKIIIFFFSGIIFLTSIVHIIIFYISKPRLLEFELRNNNELNYDIDDNINNSDDELIADINI
jgi:hypothetical protein